jgi:hypothetical protein
MSENGENNSQQPPNFEDIIQNFIQRSTSDILNTPHFTPTFNMPLNQTINIQPQPFPSNLNMLHSPIGISNSTNPINTSAIMQIFGTVGGMHGMDGMHGMQGFGDILERSMQDMGGAAKPTAKDTLDNLPIVEVFSDNVQCAICQETIKNGSKALKLPCPDTPHYFCLGDEPEKCDGIKPWLKENNTCPICRFELPIEESKKETKKDPDDYPPPLEEQTQEEQPQPETPTSTPQEGFIDNTFRNMIRNMVNEETSYVDDDGFDTREFEEAIHRSLDDSPTNADATAQAASTGDLNAMREMRLQNLEKKSEEAENSSGEGVD